MVLCVCVLGREDGNPPYPTISHVQYILTDDTIRSMSTYYQMTCLMGMLPSFHRRPGVDTIPTLPLPPPPVLYYLRAVKMVRGPKKHLKRLNAPKHWMLDKLGGIFVRV